MATTPSSSALMIHRELIDGVLSGPKGPSVAAIFDFDGTIIAGYSATVFMREQLKRGDFQVSDLSEMAAVMTRFGIGDIGFSAMMASAMQYLRGTSEADYQAFANEVFHKYIARLIYPETRALIEAHQSMGHTLAIVSSATPYQISAAADELGIEHRYSTELEVVDGSFTGQVVRPTCFGPGKVIAAHDLCDKTGTDLAKSYFYSDSFDDIELLEAVRWPRVINPNRPLREVAESREWQSESCRVDSLGRCDWQPGRLFCGRVADPGADAFATKDAKLLTGDVHRNRECVDRTRAGNSG